MTNYEKLQVEAQKTKELVNQAIIILPTDALELNMKDIKELAEAVNEKVKMTKERTANRKEDSARNNLPYVKHYNQQLLEMISFYNYK